MRSTIGNDIVYIPEFKKSLTESFIHRAYTDWEIDYCNNFHNPLIRFGSTWAAKEACYKALKQLFPDLKFWWKSLEIVRESRGNRPTLNFLKAPDTIKTSLTISHDGDYCWAICLILLS